MGTTKEWWDRHPEAKERVSRRQKAWLAAHPEAIERLRETGREAHARQVERLREAYPWRQPLFDALREAHPDGEPCDRCGEPGKMMLSYDNDARTVDLRGWRCVPCRKMVGRT